jgi:hypothetical protein
MPRPGIYDIETYAGDTLSFFASIVDIVNDVETPRDITNHTFKGEIKAQPGRSQPVVDTFTIVQSGSASEGRINIRLPASKMATLGGNETRVYYYDIQYTLTNSDVRTFLAGKLVIESEVTA